MNNPMKSEYLETIKSAEENFNELSYLSPILGDNCNPDYNPPTQEELEEQFLALSDKDSTKDCNVVDEWELL